MGKVLLLIVLLACSSPALAQWSWRVGAAGEETSFLKHRDRHAINDQATFEGFWENEYQDDRHWNLLFKPRVKIDFLAANRNRYEPRETYATYYSGPWSVTFGQQLLAFGAAESFNPTDFFNRRDLADNYYDPEKLGELALKTSYTHNFSGLLAEMSLTTYVLPLFRATPLPEENNRFALAGNVLGLPYTLLADQDHPAGFSRLKGGLKLAMVIGSVDLNFLYFHGPDWEPGFFFRIDNRGILRLAPFYYTVDGAGSNLTAVLGNWLFKLEAAFKSTATNDQRTHAIPGIAPSAIPESYAQFIPGVEYTFSDLGAAGAITLIAEYLGEATHNNALNSFRPFKNDVFLGGRWDVNDSHLMTFEAGLFKDLGSQEAILAFEFRRKLYRELKLVASGLIVQRDTDTDSPLSIFANNSSVTGRLEYTWGGDY